jgi:hypothetical protein
MGSITVRKRRLYDNQDPLSNSTPKTPLKLPIMSVKTPNLSKSRFDGSATPLQVRSNISNIPQSTLRKNSVFRNVPSNFKAEEVVSTNTKPQTAGSLSSNSSTPDSEFAVKVFLRIRPISPTTPNINFIQISDEATSSQTLVLSQVQSTLLAYMDQQPSLLRQDTYKFHKIFPGSSTQERVFSETTAPYLEKMIKTSPNESGSKGLNFLLLAYGPSGSGKTFSLGMSGVLSRSVFLLLKRIGSLQAGHGVRPKGWDSFEYYEDTVDEPIQERKEIEYSLWVSFLEIYNDKVISYSIAVEY